MRDHPILSPQPSVLTLREFEACEVALSSRDYAALRERYEGKIDVGPTDRPGVFRVAARDYVGRVSLPGGTMLVIRPKVGVSNLFYMLCVDAGLADFHPPPAGLAHDPDIFDFVIAALIAEVEKLASAGLYKAHVPLEEDLPLVRGRVSLGAQVRRYGALKHRHVCAYTDLTADTAENRVVLATLRHIPSLLRLEDELVRRARTLAWRLEGVSLVNRKEALDLLPTISLHRLNARYGPALALCRLVLNGLTLDEKGGPHPFASFLVNMPRLFERFLTAKLRARLPRHGLRVVAQRHDYLDEERQVGIRPDVLVYPTSHGRGGPLLVLDAKYRRLDGGLDDINRDLYQVSAYLDRYELSRGVLVYPQFADAAHTSLKLRGTPKRIHITTLNLDAQDVVELEEHCTGLAAQVASLAEARNTKREA